MQKWDYATLNFDVRRNGSTAMYWRWAAAEPEEIQVVGGVIDVQLARAGADGWELVAVTSASNVSGGQVFYFKRPAH